MADDLCRDWLTTLWPASFKGVPFYFEQDRENGGRGLVIHSFPNRDTPYIEDLGEEPRNYAGTAYVHGDDVDALATALMSALVSRGPGPLVVPYFGPVSVHCKEFERSTQRDQLGYVAFDVKFVRAGDSIAFVSIPLLQNTAYVRAEDAARETGALFPRTIARREQPDYVVAAAADTLMAGAAAVDLLRQRYPAEPAASAQLRDTATDIIARVPEALAGEDAGLATLAADLVGMVRSLGDALPADAALRASDDLAQAFVASVGGSVVGAASVVRAASNAEAASRLVHQAAVIAYAEATLRKTFGSRSDGVAARNAVALRFEAVLDDLSGAADTPLYLSLTALRASVIEWLLRTINDLAPVIEIQSPRIQPSLVLAWTLYADPERSGEIVARNRVRHPSFVPREIVALAR